MKDKILLKGSLSRIVVAVALLGPMGVQAKQPTPTPTPRAQGGKSLADVAKDTSLKGEGNGKKIVISNENLADYADQGTLTAVNKKKTKKNRPVQKGVGAGDSKPSVGLPAAEEEHLVERQRFWQGQYKRQLNLIVAIQNRITVLDDKIPGLWTQFYAWDDPAYRDGVIKPKLDAALIEREKLDGQLKEAQDQLDEIKADARRDGAEPGWFRGIEASTQTATPVGPPPREYPDVR
ncbi:MAG: hypothetical protein ACC742_01190 [Thermoanaerobaculales bacterium]